MKSNKKNELIFFAETTLILLIAFVIFQNLTEEKWKLESNNGPQENKISQTILEDANNSKKTTNEAYFAGGCFWCVESDFEKLEGVTEVISGYSGGTNKNPTYENYGDFNHTEVVKVIYDENKITYTELLEHFWTKIDPLNPNGQFCDNGHEYISMILYKNEEEKELAEKSKQKVEELLQKTVYTEIREFDTFWEAESYHQNYYKTHALKYKTYRKLCRRDARVNEVWKDLDLNLNELNSNEDNKYSAFKKPSDNELEELLEPIQYKVTQKEGTETPFENEYWDNNEEGIYVDILSGEPLFSSTDKYKSKTGWPSFTKPINKDYIVEKDDFKLFSKRIEIRSKYADNHIGHVFSDGPNSSEYKTGTGLRYCMNSAALKFIPKDELKEKGYEEYLSLFE